MKKHKRRTKLLQIRMTSRELNAVDDLTENYGYTRSRLVRRALLYAWLHPEVIGPDLDAEVDHG